MRSSTPVSYTHLSCTFGWIELCRRATEFSKDFLGEIFGFGAIMNDLCRDADYETRITIEKDCKRVTVSGCQMKHRLLVGESSELRIP